MSDFMKKRLQRKRYRRARAHLRIRGKISGTGERPRLSVYKSGKYVYAQLIDDAAGQTLAQASSIEPQVRSQVEGGAGGVEAAKLVGKTVAERAKAKGIETVVFDRGGYIFHGKVKAIAEAARECGLKF